MKILYFGGQKSGKSRLAEAKTLELSKDNEAYYLATYDNSYGDIEMQKRVQQHQNQEKKNLLLLKKNMNFQI